MKEKKKRNLENALISNKNIMQIYDFTIRFCGTLSISASIMLLLTFACVVKIEQLFLLYIVFRMEISILVKNIRINKRSLKSVTSFEMTVLYLTT